MNAATYEAVQSLRLVNCGQCGCLFAVPSSIDLRDGKTLCYCPRGHAWTPAPWDQLDSAGKIVELQTALAGARAQLAAARLRVETLTPLASPSLAELLRRSRVLAEHAQDAGQGRALCPYCGASKVRSRLAEHIRRRHKTLLIEDGGKVDAAKGPEGGASA